MGEEEEMVSLVGFRGLGFVLRRNAWNCLRCVGVIDLHDLSLV